MGGAFPGQFPPELRIAALIQAVLLVGLAVMVYQPTPDTPDFAPLPFYYLAKLDGLYYKDKASCELCKQGVAVENVWM